MTDVRDDQLPRGAGDAGDVVPVPAASVIVLRGHPFEVLFMRRTSTSSFVPGSWVFPGGAIDPVDRELAEGFLRGTEIDVMRVAALRELFEETGIWLGTPLEDPETTRKRVLEDPAAFRSLFEDCASRLEELVWTSRWITPAGVPKRFDTWFFLLEVDSSHDPTPDEIEGVEVRWLTPREALRLHEERSFPMVFPTIRNLEAIADADSTSSLLDSRRDVEVQRTEPVLVVDETGRKRIVLPGEE